MTVDADEAHRAAPRLVADAPWVHNVRLPLLGYTTGRVNVYVISSRVGAILVDTGFSVSVDLLSAALEAAGVGRGELRAVLVTHNHADHVGAASELRRVGWFTPDGEIVMHEMTEFVGRTLFIDRIDAFASQLLGNGLPPAELDLWTADLAEMARLADFPSQVRTVLDRERMQLGEFTAEFCYTPGHSPDHTAILLRRDDGAEVAFLGDMSLGNGLPMYGVRDWLRPDPLADVLQSWDRLLSRTTALGLPGHGRPVNDLPSLNASLIQEYGLTMTSFRAGLAGRAVTAAEIVAEQLAPNAGFGARQFAFYGSLARLRHLAAQGSAALVDSQPDRYLVLPAP